MATGRVSFQKCMLLSSLLSVLHCRARKLRSGVYGCLLAWLQPKKRKWGGLPDGDAGCPADGPQLPAGPRPAGLQQTTELTRYKGLLPSLHPASSVVCWPSGAAAC